MFRARVIPVLLIRNRGIYKSVKFKDYKYIGDTLNAVRIFNEKEVDEIIILDIEASRQGKSPDFSYIKDIASECFMPMCYGGGIRSLEDARRIFDSGIEKVALNTQATMNPDLIGEVAGVYGSQAVVVSIDYRKPLLGKLSAYISNGTVSLKTDPVEYARKMEAQGAGEILWTSIDRDGTMSGYDIENLKLVTAAVTIPVIACGGAGTVSHLTAAVKGGGASAVAAGSMFVFHGKHRAVLINFPEQRELEDLGTANESSVDINN